MPRMFDLLRGSGEPDENSGSAKQEKKIPADQEAKQGQPEGQLSKETPVNFPKTILHSGRKTDEPDDYSLVSQKLIAAVRQHGVDNADSASKIYNDAVLTIKSLLDKSKTTEDLSEFSPRINEMLDNIFNQLLLGDNLLDNVYKAKQEDYYLPYHIVNVLMLSFAIGLSMNFNKSRMDDLGKAVIFSDTGLDELRDIVIKPRKLTEEEKCWVEAHIAKSLKFAERVAPLDDAVKEAIQMHHERDNGKGYPRGLQKNAISPYAKIIGVVDTYEALTHKRNYIDEMGAHKAIKLLLGSLREYFDMDVMKAFINRMSVYPVGSLVLLNTKEIAKVVSVHPGSPLRPIVMITQDASGKPPKENTIIDLSVQDFPTIQDSFQLS